jgi:hypothetical protein
VEDELLLGLVMAAEAAHDLRAPDALVAALLDQQTVVHDLHAAAVDDLELAGILDLRDLIGVVDGGRDLDPAQQVGSEAVERVIDC